MVNRNNLYLLILDYFENNSKYGNLSIQILITLFSTVRLVSKHYGCVNVDV